MSVFYPNKQCFQLLLLLQLPPISIPPIASAANPAVAATANPAKTFFASYP